MVLVLIIGDLHIPNRTHDLPTKFKKLLVPGKIQQILLTGNVCDRETYDYLRSVAPDVQAVRGDCDEDPAWPPSLVVQHGGLTIGVIHGHQAVPWGNQEALSAIARKMDVDVLVSGGTHRFEAFEYESRFFINPGSATGAMLVGEAFTAKSPARAEGQKDYPPMPTPSFALLDVQGTLIRPIARKALLERWTGQVIVVYVYQLVEGDVKVEKIEWRARSTQNASM